MPATYAHWRFGVDCIEKMPKKLQTIVHENRDIYDLGVHGPDILFYDLFHSYIPKYGSQMHHTPAYVFFKNAKNVLDTHEEKDQIMAYILGYLTHFTLDSTCHGYVEKKRRTVEISHNIVESQWERHLMIQDNRVPNLVDRTESLKPSKANAKIIAYFYPFNNKQIYRSLNAQKGVVKMLNCISVRKQNVLKSILEKLKLFDYSDLFVGFYESLRCKDSNIRLDKLRVKAYKQFPKLMNSLLNYLNNNEELDNFFDHDFSQWPDFQNIKVLPYEEELEYKVK